MKTKVAQTGLASIFAVALTLSMAAPAQAEDESCSVARVAGTYGVSDSGTVLGIGPRAALGRLTLEADGRITGTVTASLNGAVTTGTVTGTYTVSPDCSGTTTFWRV